MQNNFQQNFNTITNFLILLILFFGGLVWSDTNGVWQYANDTRGGVFGNDEQGFTTDFTFINPVFFGQPLKSLTNPSYFITIEGRTQLNDLAVNNISSTNVNTNQLVVDNILSKDVTINGHLSVTNTNGDAISGVTSASGKSAIYGWANNSNAFSGYFDGGKFYLDVTDVNIQHLRSCNGNLAIDSTGKLICGTDNVNDGVYNLATMKTAVNNDFHNLGGTDKVDDGVYNLATMKTAVNNDFHNLGGTDNVNDGVYNLATMKTAVNNDFHNLGGTDKVDDADNIIGNEYPIAGTGISVSGRTVSVDSTIATKSYVDSVANSGISSMARVNTYNMYLQPSTCTIIFGPGQCVKNNMNIYQFNCPSGKTKVTMNIFTEYKNELGILQGTDEMQICV